MVWVAVLVLSCAIAAVYWFEARRAGVPVTPGETAIAFSVSALGLGYWCLVPALLWG